MKKIFLLSLSAILSLSAFAQWEWDDVYYIPQKDNKHRNKLSANAGYFEKQIKDPKATLGTDTASNLLGLPNGVYKVEVEGYTIRFDDEALGSITNIYDLTDGYYTICVDDESIVIKPNTDTMASYSPSVDVYHWDWWYRNRYTWRWSYGFDCYGYDPFRRWWYWGAPDYFYYGYYGYYDYYYWGSPWIYWGSPFWWSGGSYEYRASDNWQRTRSTRNQSYGTNLTNRNASRINPNTYTDRSRSLSNNGNSRTAIDGSRTYNERTNSYTGDRQTSRNNSYNSDRQTSRNNSYNSDRQQTRTYDRSTSTTTRSNSDRSVDSSSRSSSFGSSRSSSVSSGGSSSSSGGGSSRGSSNRSRR